MPAAGSEANGHAIIADDVRTYMPTLEAWSQLVGNFLWQVFFPCAAALVVAFCSLALILYWTQQEDVFNSTIDSGGTPSSLPSSTGTPQASTRSIKRGLLLSISLGILETLSGTPWPERGVELIVSGEQDRGVLSSSAMGLVQARTRGGSGARMKDEEIGP